MKIVEPYVKKNGDHYNVMIDDKQVVLIDFDSYEAAERFINEVFNALISDED